MDKLNCVKLFYKNYRNYPNRPALWIKGKTLTFKELYILAGKAQAFCSSLGLKKGDTVLLIDSPGFRLYAFITAILAVGANIIFVEPWMRPEKITSIINSVKPEYFIKNLSGTLWGFLFPAVRSIPYKIDISKFKNHPNTELAIVDVDKNTSAVTTFTTGTTGIPKKVSRQQGYLISQFEVINKYFKISEYSGMDLCIFPNFVMANLAAGRGSVLVTSKWKKKELKQIAKLKGELMPTTLTCGPAFLLKLIDCDFSFSSLSSFHIGGALTDLWILEEGFKKWPKARWVHAYGSSEAEPVALCDAREAVLKSKKRDFFQTLYLGRPVEEVEYKNKEDGLWITGVHVSPSYRADEFRNKINERERAWHCTGDRLLIDEEGWWYQGRSNQLKEDFLLEQKIYSQLKSSKCFVATDKKGRKYLYGENIDVKQLGELSNPFFKIKNIKIIRDPRHRSRIDRKKSMGKNYV